MLNDVDTSEFRTERAARLPSIVGPVAASGNSHPDRLAHLQQALWLSGSHRRGADLSARRTRFLGAGVGLSTQS